MRTRGRLEVCVLIALLLGACAQDPNVKKQQYLERGLAYQNEAKYNEAILQLKNALQIDPKFAPALHAIGRAYRAKSWSVDAMRELQRAVELEPDNLEARADLAQAYLDLDGWNAALEQADAMGGRVPETAAELYVRAAALNGKGDAQQAVTLLSKGLALGSGTPELQRALGDSLAILGRQREAEKAYRDALARRPKYPDALIGLSALLLRQGQRDAALELVTQAKAVAPQSPKVAMASSEIHARDGKLADAIKDLETLPRQAWSPRVLVVLGGYYVRAGEHEKAVLTLRPLAQSLPDALVVRYLLGHASLGRNRVDDAVADFQAIVTRAPDNPLFRYSLGSAYLAGGRAREALREFAAIAKPMEKVGEFHLQVSRAHLRLGDFDRAVKSAQIATGLMPQSAQPYGVLGAIYIAHGDLKRAEDTYAKAVEVDPSFAPSQSTSQRGKR